MGTLRSLSGAEAIRLAARVLVGRAPHCGLVLDQPRVSGEHATLVWQGEGWQVRDLASRNGTFVDGQRLTAGASARLAMGCQLVFGDVGFEVIDIDPPTASATAADGRQVVARGGVLPLPDADQPEVTVFFGGPTARVRGAGGRAQGAELTGWLLEDDAGPRPAPATVLAGGTTWHLDLPRTLPPTVEARARLSEVDLALAVSRDEEFVEPTVTIAGAAHRLESRAHHYLLATLARLRLGEPDGGWVDVEDLSRMLGLDRQPLNVQVFRARQELADLGVVDAFRLIERRVGAALRLGTTRVVVTTMP